MNINEMNAIEMIKKEISEADRILVGLGEEFDNAASLKQISEYESKKELLKKKDKEWLLPTLNSFYGKEDDIKIKEKLSHFSELLEEKDYYVITTSLNGAIREVPWREGRLVMPCGGSYQMQCENGCENEIMEVSDQIADKIETFLSSLSEESNWTKLEGFMGKCPQCGAHMILNNIYSANYDENGYLDRWKEYKAWLQGTLNKRVLILELGVTMQYPSVIRWPFEKIAFFNKKAFMYRINGRLYQLTEELNGKGCSIPQNAIDWLQFL